MLGNMVRFGLITVDQIDYISKSKVLIVSASIKQTKKNGIQETTKTTTPDIVWIVHIWQIPCLYKRINWNWNNIWLYFKQLLSLNGTFITTKKIFYRTYIHSHWKFEKHTSFISLCLVILPALIYNLNLIFMSTRHTSFNMHI